VGGNAVDGVDGAVAALDQGVKTAQNGVDGLNAKVVDLKNGIDGMDAQMADAVIYDDSTHGKITFNKGGDMAVVTNVAPGTLDAASTDAVNGSQLFDTNQNVASNTTDITNIKNGKAGLVQQSAAGANLTVGAATDGAAVDFKGTAGNRKLVNVAAGNVSATSTDALNGSQLYGLANSTAKVVGGGSSVNADSSIRSPSITIGSKTYNDLSSAITAAAAASGSIDAIVWNGTAAAYDAKHGSDATSKITHVSNGTTDNDALNLSQLNSAGFKTDSAGVVTNQAVTFDSGSIASGKACRLVQTKRRARTDDRVGCA